MEEKATSLELRDIPDITPLLPRDWWPWWAWLGCIVAIIIVLWLFRTMSSRNADAAKKHQKAYEDALREIDIAKSLQNPLSLSTELSLILRRYLSIAMDDPALFETHEEMIARHDAFASLHDSLKQELAEHFSTLCRYKYAPSPEQVDLSLLAPQATSLLRQLYVVSTSSVSTRHD
jgi:hypothetical protein